MATDPKNFKAEEDPERAFYLINFANLARDFPATAALAASFMRELSAMSLRQAERDIKASKEAAAEAAKAAATSASKEDDESPPKQARGR